MSETKARKKLEEISVKWNGKTNADHLLKAFKNIDNKYTNDRLTAIVKQYIKIHLVDGDRLFLQYETNVKKNQKTPYDALILMLNNATFTSVQQPPPQQQKPQIPAKPALLNVERQISSNVREFESPALSSTRVDVNSNNQTPEVVVSEIKEKLAQITLQAQQHHQHSRTSGTFRSSLNSSGGSVLGKKSLASPSTNVTDPFATWTYHFGDDSFLPFSAKMPKPIIGLPSSAQERVLISELLYILVGIDGSLITPKIRIETYDSKDSDYSTTVNTYMENRRISVDFEFHEDISDSMRDIIKDIIPLANYYFQLQLFIEKARAPDSGQVLQALSAALNKIIDDYLATIAQIESMHLKNELNLHKLLFYLRPIIQTMETITKTCGKIQENNMRGGNVLTYLHDSISLFSGDKNSQQILIHFTQKAAEPYMEILRMWIFKGIIPDPKNEFFVEMNEKEHETENAYFHDNYWEKHYILKHDKIPRFLEKQANIILRTGKYLNVVRDCGKKIVISNNSQSSLKFSHTDEQNYVNLINDAYHFASKNLMGIVMDDHDVMGHLLSVKRYFLLQQGDFIVQYLDACESELMKGVDQVIPMKLANLLELTLRLSSAKHDKYQDNLRTHLLPFDICTQMKRIKGRNEIGEMIDDCDEDQPDTSTLSGIECFTFDYIVNWPISILLNKITIMKYQIIFRQLFYLKHVENFLCRIWIANNSAKKFDHVTSEQYRAAFTLRQRMMNAIQNLEYYMMVEVIEPFWHILIQQISKAKNFDDVIKFHGDFMDNCMKNCMLTTEQDLFQFIIRICKVCIGFCEFMEEVQRHFIDAELSSMLSKNYINDDSSIQSVDNNQKENASESTETFAEKVTRFDTAFTQQVVLLLVGIQSQAEINHYENYISLIHRINFNNYYSDKLHLNQQ